METLPVVVELADVLKSVLILPVSSHRVSVDRRERLFKHQAVVHGEVFLDFFPRQSLLFEPVRVLHQQPPCEQAVVRCAVGSAVFVLLVGQLNLWELLSDGPGFVGAPELFIDIVCEESCVLGPLACFFS